MDINHHKFPSSIKDYTKCEMCLPYTDKQVWYTHRVIAKKGKKVWYTDISREQHVIFSLLE